MQSRRDQVQAHSYVLSRLTSALVTGEPEILENPHRRIVTGMIAGLLIGCVVVVVSVIYGLLKPGGATRWREPGTLIVEKESGGRFIVVGDELRPVYNFTSAILIFGRRPAVVTVSTHSLRSMPRGLPVGIVGAPDSPPDPAGLDGVGWSVCALTGADPAGGTRAGTLLALTRAEGAAPPLGADRGLTVGTPDGGEFLVWNGRRYALTQGWISRVLGYPDALVVTYAWLNQLPPGPDIGSVAVADRGRPGPVVDGAPARIGQLFVARVVGTEDRYFVLLGDGLSPVAATAVALILGDPATRASYPDSPVRPLDLSAAALAVLPISRQQPLAPEIPQRPPAGARLAAGTTWCARHSTSDGLVTVTMRPTAPVVADQGAPEITRTAQSATAVVTDPGVGGLVRAGRAGQPAGTTFYLVTDAGVKFPLASPAVATTLGYSLDDARAVPSSLLSLLPTGPMLDPAVATR